MVIRYINNIHELSSRIHLHQVSFDGKMVHDRKKNARRRGSVDDERGKRFNALITLAF